jgi:hypothetical protein
VLIRAYSPFTKQRSYRARDYAGVHAVAVPVASDGGGKGLELFCFRQHYPKIGPRWIQIG